MTLFGEVANVISSSVGKTSKQMILDIVQTAFPVNHPERQFIEWFIENSNRLPEACEERGVTLPEDGPNLYVRLRSVILPTFGDLM